MRVVVPVLVLALVLVPRLGASEEAPQSNETRVALRIQELLSRGDNAALQKALDESKVDPWRVAEALLANGHKDAAAQLAATVSGSAVARLADYVVSRGHFAREVWERRDAAWAAVGRKDVAAVLAQAGAVVAPTVSALDQCHARLWALKNQRQIRKASALAGDAAQAAFDMGWWTRVIEGAHDAAGLRFFLGRYRDALRFAKLQVEAATKLGSSEALGAAYSSVGLLHTRLNEHAESIEAQERSIELLKELD